jgi:hypothetical protein
VLVTPSGLSGDTVLASNLIPLLPPQHIDFTLCYGPTSRMNSLNYRVVLKYRAYLHHSQNGNLSATPRVLFISRSAAQPHTTGPIINVNMNQAAGGVHASAELIASPCVLLVSLHGLDQCCCQGSPTVAKHLAYATPGPHACNEATTRAYKLVDVRFFETSYRFFSTSLL